MDVTGSSTLTPPPRIGQPATTLGSPGWRGRQATFDELGTPLHQVTFVVVDLETTGGSAATDAITEIGAVRVCSGTVDGTFQTLVNPGTPVPPFISVLTGITDDLLTGAPRIEAVLPAFLDFARGAVLVAHNAPFDTGFLRAACERHGLAWPAPPVVDTARLARRALHRDESPDCRLATLARLFRSPTTPNHRALADATATVDVLHGLLERVGNLGVRSLEELLTYSSQVSPQVRRKRHLAEPLPSAPGVYLFRDDGGRVLYIGRSQDVRARVRSYFTAAEPRARMAEMVRLAERVDVVVCAHPLEASVRELRLIAAHKPPYNRRSRFPERCCFLKLTVEPFPRLSRVRAVRDDGGVYLGPFASARAADQAADALHEAVPLRQCGGRLPVSAGGTACALLAMRRCGAPCEGRESQEAYAVHVVAAARAIRDDPSAVVAAVTDRIHRLCRQERYEDAATQRDRLAAFLTAAHRTQSLGSLATVAELVAARRRPDGGWDVAVVRHGRLAGAGATPAGLPPRPAIAAIVSTAEVVSPGPGPVPAASAEEMETILRWLAEPGTRLVDLSGRWCSPARGASGWRHVAQPGRSGPDRWPGLADRRHLRPSNGLLGPAR